jgi:hypothetical protein
MLKFRTGALTLATWVIFSLSPSRGVSRPAPPVQDVVRAKAFELVDGAGTIRATLGFYPDGSTMLEMRDPSGKPHLSLQVSPNGDAMLGLEDLSGPRVIVSASTNGGNVSIHDPPSNGLHVGPQRTRLSDHGLELYFHGRHSAFLAMDSAGSPALDLFDGAGISRVLLSLNRNVAGFSLNDSAGNPRATLAALPDLASSGMLVIDDRTGKHRAMLNQQSLIFRDAAGGGVRGIP